MLTDEQFNRYQRQVALPEIGEQGQVKLSQSHVLMIGCGGLGSAASLYLAASGVGKLVIIDDDDVDLSNLNRQVIYRDKDISSSKTEAMTNQLLALNPAVKIRSLDKRLSKSQLELEVMLADIVLDCSDNMPTRQMINQICLEQNTDLISAAAIGWLGQFCVFDFSSQRESNACYRCLYPFDEVEQARKCTELGVIGPVVGILGNYQALAAIQKLATGRFHFKVPMLHRFDGLQMQWQYLSITKDKQCKVCS
ncbi:HesA/MoeB/ThiF family protein [Vibrio sp. Of14-4]|uniref:HesA/MoeB/ThiF family protein n=1 Tax=Vibrio sp. Of14-4 TaxID=2724878 RepID=UPI001EF25FFF|nr:HesA/MoeB/ThiF family protein [Vibrio sp. Of14-4]MCG7491747.1 HesA/MoeB/ThiF family protein [Vibrio sp. Of14-4]